MKKLRLLITKECNRNCPGCCNKLWNLDELPVCTSFEGYDEVILTGGEPNLFPLKITEVVWKINKENKKAKIYLHSADCNVWNILCILDGLTYTIHNQQDMKDFLYLDSMIYCLGLKKSLRLYLMPDVVLSEKPLCDWQIKHKTYDKDCPLPKDEVFMRLQ